MSQSLAADEPCDRVDVQTIADSLGAPMHRPLTFDLVRRHVDQLVCVSDDAMRQAMRVMFTDMKLAVEPACAAALAALTGPLCERLEGRRVALIACGSNIDVPTWLKLVNEPVD
jgi:threonine dehydratase